MPKADRTRVQFDLQTKQIEMLDEIRRRQGFSTRAEALRKCITIMCHIVRGMSDGYSLQLVKAEANGEKKTLLIVM